MSVDLVAYLSGKTLIPGGKRPTIAFDGDAVLDGFELMNAVNQANDRGDPSRAIEIVISAVSLAALRQRLGARFSNALAFLRAKNVVVKVFDELDAVLGAAGVSSQDDVTIDQLALGQAAAEGYLLVTSAAEPEIGDALLRASPHEALAAAKQVLCARTAARLVRDPSCKLDARIAALADLVDDGSADLPALLADALEQPGLASPWRDALIFAVEHTQVTDVVHRGRVIASLLRQARALRDEGSEGPLWSAVRRYASMVPVMESDALLDFLRPEDVATTKQVALQGIFNIFSHEPLRDSGARDRLRARVHELAEEHIDRERARDAERIALAHTCFRAAAALDDPGLDELFARIESLGLRRITERAAKLRDDLNASRGRTGG